MPIPSLTNAPPSWIYPGALYDFDFANGRYWNAQGGIWNGDNSSASPRSPAIICYGNSGANMNTLFTQWKDGILRPGVNGNYRPRISDWGMWCEGGAGLAHNYALQCRDLTQAVWTASNMTVAHTATGADNVANSANRLTATANNATVLQTLSFTSKLVTTSAWIKRVSGTGTISLTSDNVTWTDVTSLVNSSAYLQCPIPAQTLTNPTVGVRLGTSGDVINLDFFQTENDSVATSPVVSVASVNFRGAETNAFGVISSTNSNWGFHVLDSIQSGTPVTALIQYSGNFAPSNGHNIWNADVTSFEFTGGAGGGTVSVGTASGGFTSADSDVSGLFTRLNKVCTRADGSGSAVCINGGTVTKSSSIKSSTTAVGLTHGGTLSNGSNTLSTNGFNPRLTFWRKALTDGELISLSS